MKIRHRPLIIFAMLPLLGGTSPAWARRGSGGGHGDGGGGGMGASGIGAGDTDGVSHGQPANQQGMEESVAKKRIEGAEEGRHLGQNKSATHGRANAAPRATPAVPANPASPRPRSPGATRATPATPAVPPTPQTP